jgi:hypothetical protein
MGSTRTASTQDVGSYDLISPPASPGTTGWNDRGDPTRLAFAGDSPGTVGCNDASAALAQPAISTPAPVTRMMTPLEFEERYHTLHVPYLDSATGLVHSATVNVHIYSNNGIARRQANMSEKDRLVSLLRSEIQRAGGLGLIDVEAGHQVQIAHAFFAKGSPDECTTAFKYALRYGRTTPVGLQDYCEAKARIGLDCSGFVDNYFIAIGRISGLRNIPEYAQGKLRASVEEIRALDVLIWDKTDTEAMQHIAVVDHRIADTQKMVVVESSGSKEGLVHNEYTVLDVDPRTKIFHVDRGLDALGHRSEGHVKIAEVK